MCSGLNIVYFLIGAGRSILQCVHKYYLPVLLSLTKTKMFLRRKLSKNNTGILCYSFLWPEGRLHGTNARDRASSPFTQDREAHHHGSSFGRRLRRLCGSPWPTYHFENVLHRVGEGPKLRLILQAIPMHYSAPKNKGGSFSTVVASPWSPVHFLQYNKFSK